MIFTLPTDVPTDKRKMVEVKFLVERPANITVNGAKASAFRFGDALEIDGVTYVFSIKEGKGRFFGHISYGEEGWIISIRTLQRESHVVMEVLNNCSSSKRLRKLS